MKAIADTFALLGLLSFIVVLLGLLSFIVVPFFVALTFFGIIVAIVYEVRKLLDEADDV